MLACPRCSVCGHDEITNANIFFQLTFKMQWLLHITLMDLTYKMLHFVHPRIFIYELSLIVTVNSNFIPAQLQPTFLSHGDGLYLL
jgi:hypothetical protein